MNWLGGGKARAQQNNQRGTQQPQQNPRRPNPNAAGCDDDGTGGAPTSPTRARRLPYSNYDVASDPRYELVEKKSEVRYRTIPLLEMAKRIFPNGDVLALQLSHQIEIGKVRQKHQQQERPESSTTSQEDEISPISKSTGLQTCIPSDDEEK